jgi:hypothetical protein
VRSYSLFHTANSLLHAHNYTAGGLGKLMVLDSFEVWLCASSPHPCAAPSDPVCFTYSEIDSVFVPWGFSSALGLGRTMPSVVAPTDGYGSGSGSGSASSPPTNSSPPPPSGVWGVCVWDARVNTYEKNVTYYLSYTSPRGCSGNYPTRRRDDGKL